MKKVSRETYKHWRQTPEWSITYPSELIMHRLGSIRPINNDQPYDRLDITWRSLRERFISSIPTTIFRYNLFEIPL